MKKRGLLTVMKEKHNFLSTNEKVMNALAKFASMKILVGIRDGLTMIIPFTVIGSIFMIIGYFPIPGWADKVASVQYFFDSAVAVTFGALGLLAAIGIGYHMAKQYEGIDPFTNSCMTVIAYLLATLGKDFTISVDNLSAEGMFTAILVAILVTQVHRLFLKKNWVIHMPAGVPEALTHSFSALLPAGSIILIVWFIRVVCNVDINGLIQMMFSPLVSGVDTFWGGLIYCFLMSFLWTLGIHGDLALSGVVTPIFLQLTAENTAALAAGQAIPHIMADSMVPMFVQFSGTGCTIGLVILMLRSKCKRYKELGKMSLLPAVFNINVPVTFGFPICMNPLMAIPYIGAECITYSLTYLLMATGIIGKVCLEVSGFMPTLIGSYMCTNGNIPAVIWAALEIPLVVFIYRPFFKRAEKIELEREATTVTK